MSETATLRATSLLASTGILGGLVIVALTFTYALPAMTTIIDAPIITMAREEPPPQPPAPRPIHQPLPMPTNADPITTTFPTTPAEPITEIGEIGPLQPVAALITNPHWLRRPSDLQRYYPRAAMARGMEGDVVLDCAVATTGTLNCAVLSETPANWGFGEAARRIAAEHRMEPARQNGAAVVGRYRMRVPFRIE